MTLFTKLQQSNAPSSYPLSAIVHLIPSMCGEDLVSCVTNKKKQKKAERIRIVYLAIGNFAERINAFYENAIYPQFIGNCPQLSAKIRIYS